MESNFNFQLPTPWFAFVLDRHLLISLSLQGLSILDREPLLVGVSVSSMENAFRVVDISPNAEIRRRYSGFLF